MKKFIRSLLDPRSVASSKRFITLVMSAHFIATAFLVSFFVFYLIIYTPKGSVDKVLVDLLSSILKYDFQVITVGLGLIGVEGIVASYSKKTKPPENGGEV